MKKYSFEECCTHTGITNLAPGLNSFYEAFCLCEIEHPSFLRIDFLEEIMSKYQISGQYRNRLLEAVKEIEADEILLFFTQFLVSDMCEARHRCDLDDYRAMEPVKAMVHKDLYSMLLLIACIEPSVERLQQLGIPAVYYEDIPYIPLENQIKKYIAAGYGNVSDFPWDMNFYTCSIFLFDRFYFIPYRLDDDIAVFRQIDSDKTIAFFKGEHLVRRDGQLDGVNHVYDEQAFANVFSEDAQTVCGTPINPGGLIEDSIITLDKKEWLPVLKKGDLLMGTHIPGGKGYTPERLHKSTHLAKQFFDTYFPAMPIKGFGSESWLYDPHMNLLLEKESNICRMQNQMYIYPILSGDAQMWGELYQSQDKPPHRLETTLQKKVWDYYCQGSQMTPSAMFILYEDIDNIGDGLYRSPNTSARLMKQLTNHKE